jgi:hypothetical protein
MAHFEDFKHGDSIAHITAGEGQVTRIEDDCVVVTFDGTQRTGRFSGRYDHRWFELHPHYLVHGHTRPCIRQG